MRITLIGHASLLMETSGPRILMDPVFVDPFEDGAVVSCPSRVVNVRAMPQPDLLIISHRHPDHFDIASLNEVDRSCVVWCPQDQLMVSALRSLGFSRVRTVESSQQLCFEGIDFVILPSEYQAISEFGIVVRDGFDVVWNQVDSPLALETVAEARRRLGRPDVFFAQYASQNFEFFADRSLRFPLEEHVRNLATVAAASPRWVVPAAAGFRFTGQMDWLNRFMFPISRERFMRDLQVLVPGVRGGVMNPGDVLTVERHRVAVRPQDSPFVHMSVDDTDLLEWEPSAGMPDLVDPNPQKLPTDELEALTERLAVIPLRRYLASADAGRDRVVAEYRRCDVEYVLEVVFPDGTSRRHVFGFGRRRGRVVHRIASSALVDWMTCRRSFFYVRGFSRRWQAPYVVQMAGGDVRAEETPVPDLLLHFHYDVCPGEEESELRHLSHTLEMLWRAPDQHSRHDAQPPLIAD